MIYTVTLNPTIDRTLRYERLVLGAVNRATSARTDLSGKGVNVSVALRQMGLPSVLLGLAAGVSGRTLVEGLRAAGFDCDFVQMEAGETRSNITVIDEATGLTTKLNEAGPAVGAEHLSALVERLRQRLAPGDVCVFSGSLPPGAPDDSYARLIGAARACGARTVLDSSGAPMRLGCAARPDWIKPNTLEAAELLGCPEPSLDTPHALASAIVELMELGPTHVLLTLGARGAVCAEKVALPPARYMVGQAAQHPRGEQRGGGRCRPGRRPLCLDPGRAGERLGALGGGGGHCRGPGRGHRHAQPGAHPGAVCAGERESPVTGAE
ncbi:MAG: hexose kinase [Chloroflexota bacterium]